MLVLDGCPGGPYIHHEKEAAAMMARE